jgi:protease I
VTSWPTLQDDLRNAGANWKDSECVRDRSWVSSRKPDDLPAFNREMTKLFSEAGAAKAMKAESRDDLGVRA